jgi:predicted TIM-barrel fold metal-dependent hydrolase
VAPLAGATDCHFHVYDPQRAPGADVAAYLTLQRRLGLSRGVLVQPSAYGTDNSLHLAALSTLGRDHFRLVAIVPPDVKEAELARLDAQGVRGVRFNLKLGGPLRLDHLLPMARRLAPLGWHCQVNMTSGQLVQAAGMLRRLPCRLVLDHLGQVPQPAGLRSEAFADIRRLLDAGNTWVKLSGPYITSRLGAPDYADAGHVAAALARAAPERVLWGSDWPHPSEPAAAKPDDTVLLNLLSAWVPDPDARRRVLLDNPSELYGFPHSA